MQNASLLCLNVNKCMMPMRHAVPFSFCKNSLLQRCFFSVRKYYHYVQHHQKNVQWLQQHLASFLNRSFAVAMVIIQLATYITLLKNFALHSTKNLEILIYEEQKCIKSNTFFCVWVRLRSTRAKKLRVSDSNKFKFQNSKLNNFVCVCVCFPLENAAFLSSHLFQKNKSSIIGNGFSIT